MLLSRTALPVYAARDGAYHRRRRVVNDVYDIIARDRARKFGRFIFPKMRVFEFGVGSGFNLAHLPCRLRTGHDAFCSAELERKRIGFRWATEGIKTHSFDAVICHHTLEHMPDPWNALTEMRRLLVPNGLLIVNVPHEVERQSRRFDASVKNGHLFSWTPQTLGMLLASRGFTVESVRIQPFGYDRFAAVVARNLRGNDTLYRFIRACLLMMRPRYEIVALCRR